MCCQPLFSACLAEQPGSGHMLGGSEPHGAEPFRTAHWAAAGDQLDADRGPRNNPCMHPVSHCSYLSAAREGGRVGNARYGSGCSNSNRNGNDVDAGEATAVAPRWFLK